MKITLNPSQSPPLKLYMNSYHKDKVINDFPIQVESEQKMNEVCKVCLLDLHENGQDIFSMDTCLHSYHSPCLNTYFHEQIVDKKYPMKCPDVNCKEEFSVANLKEWTRDDILVMFYEAALETFILKNEQDAILCPTPGCTHVFSFSKDLVSLDCPDCHKKCCLKCHNKKHGGKCGDHGFIELAEYLCYKTCPSCKSWIEKTDEWHHMTCKCGFEFCYNCGQDYFKHRDCGSLFQQKYYKDFKEFIANHQHVFDVPKETRITKKKGKK